MDDDTKSADKEIAAFVQERARPQPTANAPKYLSQFRAQRLSLRKRPKADNAAARPFVPHTFVGGAQATAGAHLTGPDAVRAKPERLVHGAQPVEESHSDSRAYTAVGGPAHGPAGLLNEPNGGSTAQQAQRSTCTASGIPEALGRPAFTQAARRGSAVQAWVPRRRNWASFDALDDLPDLSGCQQAAAGKPSRDPQATGQPVIAGSQPSEYCSEALRPLPSSLRNMAPFSRDDRPAPGEKQSEDGFAHSAASTAQGRLQCDESHSSALRSPSRQTQPKMSESATPGSPSGARIGTEVPQCKMQSLDRARCEAHAVPCASAVSRAAKGREHQLQPAGMSGPHRKPFAAPRPDGSARGFNPSSAGEGPTHAAQRPGSQSRPSGLQPAAEGDTRQAGLAGTACCGRVGARRPGSSSMPELQVPDAEVPEKDMRRDATGNRSAEQEPVMSDSWGDSDSSEHSKVSHPHDDSSEPQGSRAARLHMPLNQETGEHSSRAGWRTQQKAAQDQAAQGSAQAGAPGRGLVALEGASGQTTHRRRLKRLYNAPASLDADADTGSGHSTEDEDADLLAPPGVLPRAQPAANGAADIKMHRSPLAEALGSSVDRALQPMPETLESIIEPDVDILYGSPQPSVDLGMQVHAVCGGPGISVGGGAIAEPPGLGQGLHASGSVRAPLKRLRRAAEPDLAPSAAQQVSEATRQAEDPAEKAKRCPGKAGLPQLHKSNPFMSRRTAFKQESTLACHAAPAQLQNKGAGDELSRADIQSLLHDPLPAQQAKAKGCFTKALEAAGADVINLASDDSAEGAPSHKRRTHKPKRLLRLPAMPPQAQQRALQPRQPGNRAYLGAYSSADIPADPLEAGADDAERHTASIAEEAWHQSKHGHGEAGWYRGDNSMATEEPGAPYTSADVERDAWPDCEGASNMDHAREQSARHGGTCAHEGGPTCQSGHPRVGPPWWHRLNDFVPVAALRNHRDPRDGSLVHINYAAQFSGEKPPAAEGGGFQGAKRGRKAKRAAAGAQAGAAAQREESGEGAPQGGRWMSGHQHRHYRKAGHAAGSRRSVTDNEGWRSKSRRQ